MAIRTGTEKAVVLAAHGPGFANPYGRFEGPDFLIENVLTPRPWVNVLANDRYGVVLSQSGGGFSWFDNCQLFRLTRWEQDLVSDSYGRFVYLVDRPTGAVWSTTYQPTREAGEVDTVRHGLGFTTYTRQINGVRSVHTVFVPPGLPYEVWTIDIENIGESRRELRIGSYLEWHLGGTGEWHREFHRLFMSTSTHGSTLLAWKRQGLEENSRSRSSESPTAFLSCYGLDGLSWFTDKEQWLGRLGTTSSPQALLSSVPPHTTGRWDDPIGAFRAELTLDPGESRRLVVVLGAAVGQGEALRLTGSFDHQDVDALLTKTRDHHRANCGSLDIHCKDGLVELMANAWLPYQAHVGRIQARCAYYQQGGAFGYRDQLQDSLLHLDDRPSQALDQIGIHAEAMYEDGAVRHWWHPGTKIYAESRHSDTCLWLAYAVLEYLDETADLSVLGSEHGYLSRDTQTIGRKGSLIDHCRRGIDRALERRSPRGLPLIGAGDWNDGLSHAGLEGRGESVWLAMFLFDVLTRFAPILERMGDTAGAASYRLEAESLRHSVESHAWDGEWYIAGTSDDGRPFGSKESTEGRIYLNPQTWAVISGIASPERSKRAIESVRQHLLKPYGALLLAPAYHEVDPYVGYITRYAPGLRENGGVYSHASTWAVQALAMTGDAEGAWTLWRGMCPPERSQLDADLYAAEPFVMPGNADGPDSPFESRAGWTWYTGSAAWMRRVLVRWILGVRPTYDGLLVSPLLPAEMSQFSLVRTFRGTEFQISVSGTSPYALTVDGEPTKGVILPEASRTQRTVHAVGTP